MKKIYTMLAMAATGLTAFAAPQSADVLAKDAQMTKMIESITMDAQSLKKAPAMKLERQRKTPITSVADLLGPYSLTTNWWLFSGEDPFDGHQYPYFHQGNTENEIIITGMPYSDIEIVATVNMSAKTMTIAANQELMVIPGSGTMILDIRTMTTTDAGNGQVNLSWATKASSMVLHFDENGFVDAEKMFESLDFDSYDAFMLMNRDKEGYGWGGWAGLNYDMLPFFTMSGEWRNVGQSSFKDGLLYHFFQNANADIETTGIPTYRQGNFVALEDPYNRGQWAQVNDRAALGINEPGYFVFNIEYPECVWMRPVTGSGFWMEDEEGGWEVYPFNEEGAKVMFEDYTPEEVYDEYMAVEVECSHYDAATNTVQLENIWFGDNMGPLTRYGFLESGSVQDGTAVWYPLYLTITVPDMNGVNEIGMDSNAPVRYFNLQGVEVMNPAKGQVVIKSQGNKSSKFIVK